ncbi:hypothetical protein Ancab_006616 [Ancistrocladus abbreviatus]
MLELVWKSTKQRNPSDLQIMKIAKCTPQRFKIKVIASHKVLQWRSNPSVLENMNLFGRDTRLERVTEKKVNETMAAVLHVAALPLHSSSCSAPPPS